jgi:Family of unknown function (DUF5681)
MTWQSGESGNPGGFRGKKPVSDAIAMELAAAEQGREDPVPARSLRAAIRRQLEKAAKGDLNALVFIAERTEGKARTIIAGDAAEPLAFRVEHGHEARLHIEEALRRIASRVVSADPDPETLTLGKE